MELKKPYAHFACVQAWNMGLAGRRMQLLSKAGCLGALNRGLDLVYDLHEAWRIWHILLSSGHDMRSLCPSSVRGWEQAFCCLEDNLRLCHQKGLGKR